MLHVQEAPCSAKNRNDMFSKYVLFKKGHLNKRAGVWTPPGSATAVLGSQPAGDMSHKPGGRLPLLSAWPAVTLAALKTAATNFAAW